jgi:hypothetical protein
MMAEVVAGPLAKCPYCGRENGEGSPHCLGCGTRLLEDPPAEAQPPRLPPEMTFAQKLGLWFVAWAVAAVAAMIPHPRLLLAAFLFPLGLLRCLSRSGFTEEDCYAAMLLAWFFYGLLTIAGLLQRRRRYYFLLYSILCVLLILNVVGCHIIVNVDLNSRGPGG